jgi:hypothetical protein
LLDHDAAGRDVQEENAMSWAADSIRRGLEEAIACAESKADKRAYRIHVPKKMDMKAIHISDRLSWIS